MSLHLSHLSNTLQEDGGSISHSTPSNFQVVVRLRPIKFQNDPLTDEDNNKILQVGDDLKSIIIRRGESYPEYCFMYDRIFDEYTSQKLLYSKATVPIVRAMLKGINSTIITYGMSRSGKSYTLEGHSEQDRKGVIPRVIDDLLQFVKVNAQQLEERFIIRVSAVQIYNDIVSDLLQFGSHHLKITESVKSGKSTGSIHVADLSDLIIKESQDIYKVFKAIKANRATPSSIPKPPDLNSRSHTIITLSLERIKTSSGNSRAKGTVVSSKRTKINFVELAASEKAKSIDAYTSFSSAGARPSDDGHKIAKSFNAISSVIASIQHGASHGQHIPYRDSKLTHLLRDTLNEDSLCLFIACMYPLSDNYAETLATAKFSSRIRKSSLPISNPEESYSQPESMNMSSTRVTFSIPEKIESSRDVPTEPVFSAMDEKDEETITLKSELRRTKDECDRLLEERTLLAEQLSEIKSDVSRVMENREVIHQELERQKEENTRETIALETIKLQLSEYKNKYEVTESEKSLLKQNLEENQFILNKAEDENKLLKEQLKVFKGEISNIRDERDQWKRESEELTHQVNSLQSEVRSLNVESNHWKQKSESLEVERKALRQEILDSNRKISQANEIEVSLKEIIGKLKNELTEASIIQSSIEKELQTKTDRIKDLEFEIDDIHREQFSKSLREFPIETSSTELDALKRQISLLKRENQQLKEQSGKSESSIILQLNSQLNDFKIENENLLNRLVLLEKNSPQDIWDSQLNQIFKSQKEKMESEFISLQHQINNLQSQNSQLQRELLVKFSDGSANSLISRAEQLLEEKIRLEKEVTERRRSLQKEQGEIYHLQLQLSAQKTSENKLKEQKEDLEKDLLKSKSIISRQQAELEIIPSLETKIKSLEDESQSLKKDNEKLHLIQEDLEYSLKRNKDELSDVRVALERLLEERTDLSKIISVYQPNIESSHSFNKEGSEINHRIRDLVRSYEQKSSLLSKLSSDYDKIIYEKQFLKEKLDELALAGEKLASEKEQLERQKESHVLQISILESKLSSAKNEISKREQELAHLESERNDLSKKITSLRDSFFLIKEESLKIREELSLHKKDQLETTGALNRLKDVLRSPTKMSKSISFTNDLDILVSEVQILTEQHRSMYLKVEEMTMELNNVCNQRSTLQNELENQIHQNNLVKKELKLLEKHINSLESDLQKEKDERDYIQNGYDTLKRSHNQIEHSHTNTLDELAQVSTNLSETRSKLKEKEELISNLSNKITATESELKFSREKVSSLDYQLEIQLEKNRNLVAHQESLKDDISELKRTVSSQSDELSELQDNLRNVRSKLQNSNEENHHLQLKNQNSEEENRKLSIQNSELRNDLEKIRDTCDRFEKTVKEFTLSNSDLKLELHHSQSLSQSLSQDLDSKNHEIHQLEQALASSKADNDQLSLRYEHELRRVKSDNDAFSEEIVDLKSKIQNLKSQINELEDESQKRGSKIKDLETRIKEKESEINRLSEGVASLENRCSRIESEKASLISQLDQSRVSYDQKSSELKRSLDQIQETKALYNQLELELSSVRNSLHQSEIKCDTTTLERDQLFEQLGQYEKEFDKLKSDRDEYRVKLLKAQDQCNLYIDEKKDLNRKLATSEETIDRLRKEIDRCESQLREAKVELKKAMQTEQELRKLQTELNDFKSREEHLLDEISVCQHEVRMIQEEKNRLQGKLMDKELELDHVKESSQKTTRDLKNIIRTFGL